MRSSRGRTGTRASTTWLTTNVRTLAVVSFLQDTASEMLYPILPIFVTSVLGAPAGAVGAIEGVAEGGAATLKLVSGRLSDRRAKRPFVAAGYGAAALGKAVIAVAFTWPVVLVGRVIDRLGKGLRSAPRDVLLMQDVPTAARGRVFGFHRAADTAGAVVGPLIGLALFELFSGEYRPLLVVAVVPAVLSTLLVAVVRERPVAPGVAPGVAHGDAPGPTGSGPPPALPRELRRLITVLGVFGLVNFPDALLLLRAADLGLGAGALIAAYATYNACYAALSYPAGALADRWSPRRAFAVGLGFFAVGYLGLALISEPGWVFVVLPLYGGFAAFTDGVGKAWVSSLAPPAAQGRAQGLYQGVSGGAVLVAGLWAGAAWGGDGRGPLIISGTVALVVAAVLLAGGRARPGLRGRLS